MVRRIRLNDEESHKQTLINDAGLEIEADIDLPFPGAILPPEQWAKTAIKRLPDAGPLDLAELFGRSGPVVLEIGCGNGRFVISSAVRRPDHLHIGIDSLPMVIRYATRRANQRGLHHVRIAVCDGEAFVNKYLGPASLSELHVYHPQPFRNPYEASKRLIKPAFLGKAHGCLTVGGRFYLQTDNREYWEYIQQVMPKLFRWQLQTGPWTEDPWGRSRREIIAQRKGLEIYRGWGEKESELDEQALQPILAALPEPQFTIRQPKNRTGWRRPRRR